MSKLYDPFRRMIFVLLAALTCGSTGTCWAQDWANWRGPEANGISRETNLVEDWSFEPQKNAAWVTEPGGRSTPIVLNGRVYINCRTMDDIAKPATRIHSQDQVVCFDAVTGKEIWRDKFNVFQTDIPAPRVGWAAMCGDTETGNVYVHPVSGLFRCYSGDGKLLWERSLSEEFGEITGYGGRCQTPIIDEDRVIISFMATNWGSEKGPGPLHYYYAFDKKTGELQWKSAPGGPPADTNYSVPIVAVIKGQRMLIGGNCDGNVYSINARTGKPIWKFRMSQRGLNVSPVVEGNNVFIANGEDNIDSQEFGRVQCIDATGTGDVTETHSVWRDDGIKAGYTALVVQDGILYVMADLGNLHAYDSKTGTELWQHDLGTVGKGSPVWADGKIYATEVNGHMWILKPSREGCETLSEVVIDGKGTSVPDEIYSSPAIANGCVYLVTRDRTICITDKTKTVALGTPEKLPAETPATDKIDLIQLRPYETIVAAGQPIEYTTHAFDANGSLVWKKPTENLTLVDGLDGFHIEGNKLLAPSSEQDFAGTVSTSVGDLTATARVRMYNPASKWSWDFEGYKGVQVPVTWNRAFAKLKPEAFEDGTVMKVTGGTAAKGRPSHSIAIGPPGMKNYEIQADCYFLEQRRQLASVGITNERYDLILKGNSGKLEIESWQPHKRLATEKSFRTDPNVWYRMKLKVVDGSDGAQVMGKVWKRDEAEPAEWTIEKTDPHPNEVGPPGIYFFAQADCYIDNVVVTKEQEK